MNLHKQSTYVGAKHLAKILKSTLTADKKLKGHVLFGWGTSVMIHWLFWAMGWSNKRLGYYGGPLIGWVTRMLQELVGETRRSVDWLGH